MLITIEFQTFSSSPLLGVCVCSPITSIFRVFSVRVCAHVYEGHLHKHLIGDCIKTYRQQKRKREMQNSSKRKKEESKKQTHFGSCVCGTNRSAYNRYHHNHTHTHTQTKTSTSEQKAHTVCECWCCNNRVI